MIHARCFFMVITYFTPQSCRDMIFWAWRVGEGERESVARWRKDWRKRVANFICNNPWDFAQFVDRTHTRMTLCIHKSWNIREWSIRGFMGVEFSRVARRRRIFLSSFHRRKSLRDISEDRRWRNFLALSKENHCCSLLVLLHSCSKLLRMRENEQPKKIPNVLFTGCLTIFELFPVGAGKSTKSFAHDECLE